jgi:hypothetical protein
VACDERADCNPFGSFGSFGSFSFGPERDGAALDARTPKSHSQLPKPPPNHLWSWELGVGNFGVKRLAVFRAGRILTPYINSVPLKMTIL